MQAHRICHSCFSDRGLLDVWQTDIRCHARWDASQIYGTTEERAALLRVDSTKCELRVDEDGFMPLNATDGIPEGGAAHVLRHLHC